MRPDKRSLGNIPRDAIRTFLRKSPYKAFTGPVKTGVYTLTKAQLEEDGYVGMWTRDPPRRA